MKPFETLSSELSSPPNRQTVQHHLIIGYGYCGFYLARYLLSLKQSVTAISRHLDPAFQLEGLVHLEQDISLPIHWDNNNTLLYYLIPPQAEGTGDERLRLFLEHSSITAKKVIYFGSSGVYGNHQGAWVSEQSLCHIDNDRQRRRLDAEQQWQTFCEQHAADLVILRIAGIYGSKRLPIQAAMERSPIIDSQHAPYINHIYVNDLSRIAASLALADQGKGIYNIADGEPQKMGTLQQRCAQALGLESPLTEDFSSAWESAGLMKREFMRGSKRLDVSALRHALGAKSWFTPLDKAIIESLQQIPIVIFGGTFDPIHFGHLNAALAILEHLKTVRLIMLPCKQPLLKDQSLASTEQRVEMLKLAVEPYPTIDLDLREIERDTPSFMVDTLESFRTELGSNLSISLVLGFDAFLQLPQWHRWEQLLTLCNVLLINRGNVAETDLPIPLQELLDAHRCNNPWHILNQPCGLIYRFDAGSYDVSSSWIRQQINLGVDVGHYLAEKVYRFIKDQQLYQ